MALSIYIYIYCQGNFLITSALKSKIFEPAKRKSHLDSFLALFGLFQDFFRNSQSTVGGPKCTKMDLFRPKWTILVHFGLANAKFQFGIGSS